MIQQHSFVKNLLKQENAGRKYHYFLPNIIRHRYENTVYEKELFAKDFLLSTHSFINAQGKFSDEGVSHCSAAKR